jgi:uncharacterized protein (TIGR03437 family)
VFGRSAILALLGAVCALAQSQSNSGSIRPLVVTTTQYRLRAGERVAIDAAPETVDFMRGATKRTAAPIPEQARPFAIAPNILGDQVLLGVPLATAPGEYEVTISAVSRSGEERRATVSVTVDALATIPASATAPPVVLLDGWQQPSLTSSCPMSNDSTGTFGNLGQYLHYPPASSDYAAPAVYFFENCTECPNCAIEQLGADLATFLNSVQYTDGTPVPQFDVIAHSMGGLIVRSYLSGKQQASGGFSPPAMPKIRKSIFVATPHFGSFQADSGLSILFFAGNQTNEMKRGSPFIWDLATWNQLSDDLRGTDALAVIGNAGSFENLSSASDGVVALTSGSLDFATPGRTRIVNYCHIPTDSGLEEAIEAEYLGCTGPGIANIDSPSHQTYQIVSSFLSGSVAWQSVGTAPAQDPYLSRYGGMVVADVNPSDQYVTPPSVLWGGVALTTGAAAELYYKDLVSGTATFAFGSSTCGPYTQPAGVYSAVRCKFAPTVYSVGPLLSGTGKVVQAGTTITINGTGFGSQCSGCQVVAAPPGSTTGYLLPVSSWTNQAISASFLPATMPNLTVPGLVTIYVELSSSAWDSINIMAAPASTIAVAPISLQFAYTAGGTIPAAKSIQITNSGGGTLNWSATTSASWLSVSLPISGTAPSTLSVVVSPTGLGAGTYTGSLQISAAGASNSPQTVSVTLTVNAPPPTISLSAVQLHFSYVVGGVAPASQSVVVSNSGGGTFTWSAASSASWLTLSSAPGVLTVAINLAGLSPNTYTGTITITAAGASNSPQAVSVTLTVTAPPPSISLSTGQAHFAYATGGAPPAPQSISISNSGGGTLAWSASSNASWLSATPSGTAPSTLTISVTPTSLTPGPYQGAITVSAAGAANSPQTISVSLTVSAAVPSVVITSVTNSASGASGAIAPGEIITIKGSGLGPATGVSFSVDPNTGMVDSTLAGTVVLFGSFAAPITYASAAQINAIVPYEVAGPPQIAVQVQYQGAVSNSFTVQVAAAAPGAFTFNSTGAGQAVAANQDGSFNGPSNPAPKGSYLTIYFTGGGQTNPSGVTGSVTGAVLKWLAQPITVTVGGQQVTVAFDGTAPTFVDGVGQLNIQLPTAMPSGSALPLVITVGGFASPNTATLAVQ